MNWQKKNIDSEQVKKFSERYGLDLISSSILIRRGITEGREILYFLEDDLRFEHSPFLFFEMENVVERIFQARDENESVFIFGDKDVDGMTSTVLLYENLCRYGIKTFWRLPHENETHGLNKTAVDEAAKNECTLLITVDCGIVNCEEVEYAHSLGIDVIILDHHEAAENLPDALIINPKCENSGYPFRSISGCGVVYKVASALRFASKCNFYNQEISLLNVKPINDAFMVECIKTQNLCECDRISESIVPGILDFKKTRIFDFLQDSQIFVWDKKVTEKLLKEAFGKSIEFNTFDIRESVQELFPQVKNLSLLRIKDLSKIAKYIPEKSSEIDGFFNIFVTFVQKNLEKKFPEQKLEVERDLQLVALSTLGDVMPLTNENLILVKNGFSSINSINCINFDSKNFQKSATQKNQSQVREGLYELFLNLKLLDRKISSVDLSWNVIPVLNAAGRMGIPELGVKLFIEKDKTKRQKIAEKIIALNEERKENGAKGMKIALSTAEKSFFEHSKKFCAIYDEKIDKGVTGLLATKLCEKFNVPTIVATKFDGVILASMRAKNLSCNEFLCEFEEFFKTFGGHAGAAGFSIDSDEKAQNFFSQLKNRAQSLMLEENSNDSQIDAELPADCLTEKIFNLIDNFEPYGEKNRELIFLSKNLKIYDAILLGKSEPYHLKLTLDCKKSKWPALFWGEGARLGKDFSKGDKIDILYSIQRNYFNGNVTPQMILHDVKKSCEN